ncbi:MAG: MoaD/ThiS family protein [Candidatus Bathyarchaeia archaeon]
MKITIRVFGSLAPVLGREHAIIFDKEARVRSLTQMLFDDVRGVKNLFSEAQDRGGGELVVLINGRNIDTLDGLDTILKDGDVVTILTPFAGG